MCLFQERLEEMSTPRYLDCVSASRVCFFRLKTKMTGDRARVMRRTLHLSGWNSQSHISSHVASSLKSSCSWRQSWIDLTVRYMIQASAKSLVLEVTVSGRSLMNIRNSKGPKKVPWGTALITSTLSEVAPSTTTCWFLFYRNYLIQLYVGPLMP